MEQELHQVVRDQQDQAQPVEAKRDWTEREEVIKDPDKGPHQEPDQ